MKIKRSLKVAIPATLAAILIAVFVVKADNIIKLIKPDPAFKDYITAYTSGVISVSSPIKIRMAEPYADSSIIGKTLDAKLFNLKPEMDGTVSWIDPRTLQFKPKGKFKQDETYTVDFALSELIDVADSLKNFVFQFHTIKQNFEVKVLSLNTYDDEKAVDNYYLKGWLKTADDASVEEVSKLVTAYHMETELDIKFIPSSKSKRYFEIRIDSIQRMDEETEVKVFWNGKSMGIDKKGDHTIKVHSRESFRVMDVNMKNDPQQVLTISFSDPLDNSQALDGLIRVGNQRNLQFEIDNNEIKVYFRRIIEGDETVTIEASIRNSSGKSLGKKTFRTITVESTKPMVRMVGDGTILPSSNKLSIPFEAVNLHKVDVKVLKVYEQNVPQFLQVNELAGTREMYRVGKIIYKGDLDLTKTDNAVVDYNRWNRFHLNLSKIIKTEPGAIYRVIFSFKKEYSTYPCEEDDSEESDDLEDFDFGDVEEVDDEQWGYYSDYEYNYAYWRYDWEDRENPCSPAYYFHKTAARNVLASDVGLITKRGSDGSLVIYATDLVTAKPLKGVKLELLDYQQQILKKLVTDEEGKASVKLRRRPFLLVAKHGDQRGYLKLHNGGALSLSLFDVDGDEVKRGIKGFLYAERGVWRPGDTMFINFVLEDKNDNLPDDAPVMFEMSNPKGQVVRRMVAKNAVKNIYPFHMATDQNDITGQYLAKVYIGNLVFSKYFRVETVKPNRLKIELKCKGDKIKAYDPEPVTLKSVWLHGAKASNLKATVQFSLEKGTTMFEGYGNYVFDDPATNFYTETSTIFDSKLNEEGVASFNVYGKQSRSAPGVLKATFNTKVFERGGNFSVNTISVPYYPYESYAGLWAPAGKGWWDALATGKKHRFHLANLDINGKGLAESKLNVKVYRVDWRWWYHSSSHRLSSFLSNSENIPVYDETIKIKKGKGYFDWGMEDEEWGRYLIHVTDLASGHSTGKMVFMDWPGYSRRRGESKEGASMLAFSSDKQKYNVGETINVTIPTSVSGRALVSIENGTKVIESKWIEAESGTTRYSFEATEDMAPNVYVHITLLQPHQQTVNDLPIRLYGVIPIKVEDPNTHLYPVITMKDKIKPESKVSIKVGEKNGKAMAYTLAVVDEGLLDLTNFKTPDPWNNFYAKEALGVKTWDLFDDVMGAWGDELERLLSIGGGGTRVNKDKQKANRFKPVVKFFGPFYLEAGKTETHTFTMPQYVGSVRVMLVAANDGAYGNAEKAVQVKSPLMVTGTLPRVVGPGETVSLPVNIFAMEKTVKNVKVSLKANNMFDIIGSTTANVKFSQTGEKMVYFNLKAKEKIGIGKVNIQASSKNHTINYDVELDVRNANPPLTTVAKTIVEDGKTYDKTFPLGGIPGTNEVKYELSVLPAMNLSKRLNYLIRYPHGCLEQTMSAAFPQLFIDDLVDLDAQSKKDLDYNVRAAINKLNSFANSDGSFSYWPGGRYRNTWSNIYAGQFLIEAKNQGYHVPNDLLKPYLKTLGEDARNWSRYSYYRYDDLIQANRLYLLALAGEKEMGAMNRLKNADKLSLQASWRLAAAYAAAGKKKVAEKMVSKLSTEISPYVEYSYTFGSRLRDQAIILETYTLLDMKTEALMLVKTIAERLNSKYWYSTHTTAFAINALAQYYRKIGGAGKGIDCQLISNGKIVNVSTDKAVYVYNVTGISNKKECKVKLVNKSDVPIFLNIVNTGTPLPGNEAASSSKIRVKVHYYTMSGNTIDPSKLKQGTDFKARITVENTSAIYYREMALTHIVPSGWEIINDRIMGFNDSRTDSDDNITYQDIRDDRILTYFNINPYDKMSFYVKLNATYAGKYYLPAILAEAMYSEEVRANTEGKWIEVVKPKE